MSGYITHAFSILADPYVLFVITLSSFYGLFIGAIPGLTATMATALLVPLTFFMDPLPALAAIAIVTMEAMAIFSGDIPATLVRIPGTPSSAAYTQDSYELTKKGHAELALGVDLVFSVIGGLMGAVVLIIAAPMLAEFAMKFTTIEYFWLATLGLSASVMVSRGSLIKGAFSLLFGLALSTVGVDIALGFPRFTFGNVELLNGINFIPARSGISLNSFPAPLASSFVCWHCWFGFSRSLWAFYRKGFKTPKRSLKIKMEVFVRVYVTVNHPSSGFSR